MLQSKVIAVDVDLTFVDSLTPWLNWFKEKTGRLPENKHRVYDLTPEMREIVSEVGMDFDPYDFWHKSDLYDDLSPLPGAVEALTELRSKGAKIIFVSLCDSGHIESKLRFLKRNVAFDGFISTAEKHFVAYDVLIDDRAYHHKMGILHRPQAHHFCFNGLFRGTDGSDIPDNVATVSDWELVVPFIQLAFEDDK